MVGRPDPFKGHAVFIDAALLIKKRVEGARFLIIGDASPKERGEKIYLESLRERIRDLGLADSIVFTGFRDDILSAIAALDVLVAPSVVIKTGIHNIAEGFGRVAIEAMAAGVPVVASYTGGLKEIIESGVSGILVPANDSAAIAEGVVSLLKDPHKADAMRAAAKKEFDALYSVKALDKLYELYDRITERGGVEYERTCKR
jgi:glycosyltransferase involved in cell wall biosynthesis